MLTWLQVKNFRSLENVNLPIGSLTAIVGPNGVGKTAILRAIGLVLGDAWPSLRSFRIPQDFTNFDTARDIEITVYFDPPYVHRDKLSNEHRVTALRLTCKPYKKSGKWGSAGDLHVDFDPLDEKGDIPIVAVGQPTKGLKTPFGPLRIGTELRDYARVLFIDHRRSLAQHLPSVRGSILSRLLQPARKEWESQDDFNKAYEQAMDLLRTEKVKEIELTVAETTKRMLGFLGRSVAESVEIDFGFANPANPFNSLRLQYRESGLIVPGEELGLGIQSAMVVGIFEAFRQLGGDFGTIIIEEPEMYLHPQAQRYFYRLLCEMADNGQCQVIYSTHSPIFADVNRFESLRLVRRSPGQRTHVSLVTPDREAKLKEARDRFKLGGRFDTARNEVLFASCALLVEGYADRIAALIIAEKLGFDLDAEGVAVVECGGKAGIELIVRVCQALKIPFLVVHDEDVWPTDDIADEEKRRRQEEDNEKEKAMNKRIQAAIEDDSLPFVFSPSLEAVLGISRNASDKPRRVAELLNSMNMNEVREKLQPLVAALEMLSSQIDANEDNDVVAPEAH